MLKNPKTLPRTVFEETKHESFVFRQKIVFPLNFRQPPATIKGGAPRIGEDTAAVLEELGYSTEDVTRLVKEGAVIALS